jgi:hypothetical protein
VPPRPFAVGGSALATLSVIPFVLKEVVMKRLAVFAMVVIVLGSARTYLAAQSAPASAPGVAKPPIPAVSPQAPIDVAHNATVPLTPLQQHYMDLAAQKVRLMTEEQLQKAVNEVDHEVQELNAWSKVEESVRQLREVIDKNPQTQAAEAARSALEAIERHRSGRGFTGDKRYEREKSDVVPFGSDRVPFDRGS